MPNPLVGSIVTALFAVTPLHADAVKLTRLPPVPDAIGFAGAFAGVHGTWLMAGGGANFPDGVMPWNGGKKVWHDRLFALDLAQPDAKWEQIGRLPTPNGYGVSLTVPEGVLLVGGGDASRNFKEVSLLTLREGKPSFEDYPALPASRAQMAGALVGREVHLYGGIESPDATRAEGTHWMLDLDALGKGWQELKPLPAEGRILATACGIGDRFFVAGGCSLEPDEAGKPKRTYLKEAWQYRDGTWSRLCDLPRAAVAAASPAPVEDGAFFVVSGDDGTQANLGSPADHCGFTSGILRYDVAEAQWSQSGALQVPPTVTLPTAPWKGGYIFFNGEVKPGVRTPEVFLFNPEVGR
ncbi:galactose oxidase [Luteolibacter luteus]|uniref:Galactose oxidase n=1 Tax=Luteolibacter luteus TaxID=2728835 RepID=A0A858RF41_9BACT|nr:galactose oxidase [Luteolibacter luteus]QJE94920.1 galactose oxidase [Luteolibacter luteus]